MTHSLMARRWAISSSKSGSFIGSDSPVALDGPKGVKVGFKNAEIVTYPVSRHVLLYGTKVAVMPPFVSRKYTAYWNTFAMLTAEAQVYSHTSDFCWLDETHRYQTDWRLFSKEKFQRLKPTPTCSLNPLARRVLAGQQERFDQLALAADDHSWKALVPVTLGDLRFGIQPASQWLQHLC